VAATADWRVLSWLQPHYHSFLPWAKAVNGQVARSTRCSFARRGIVASSVARQTQTCAQHHPHATIQGARRSEPRAPSPCPLPTHVRDESLGIKARHPANARCNACQLGVMRCSCSRSCERNVPGLSPLVPRPTMHDSANQKIQHRAAHGVGSHWPWSLLHMHSVAFYSFRTTDVQDYSSVTIMPLVHGAPWLCMHARLL
jgi:hypothetical protein